MATTKPFLLRFKFAGFANLPSSPGDFLYSDRVTDRRHGNVWQLQLYPGGTALQVNANNSNNNTIVHVSAFLHNVEGPDVNAKTTFIVRDAYGNTFHRETSEDVDCYKALKECFGYFAFVERSVVLDEANSILLREMLIVDVEVQTGSKPPPRRLVSKNHHILDGNDF
mmetsp:Transcript_1074/g.1863  ORF Transcript_1074/g.1863 Transcript_1074/m.1863 type:complete len:168 (+) Transcript_1074:81-584(+)|eukprot:CAMPEP_0196133150 /NCGR_PEP_ID=MMETSP0910-20130528/2493_1 /TAXON_ID=49265 /ORGANISM="Thalassiosira rotula, Strain GSO102" /LENGTH=167 /DNA_ID=CAMNT_0041392845 /DNA_START=39 /DNA_END=542 /DNA_ORIENTATION=+